MMEKTNDTLSFRVSAGLKNLIGRDLISDKYIAVFELVKNSYDAGASKVKISYLISDEGELLKLINETLDNNPQSIVDFKNGKDRAIGFLVGQIMKKTQGKANPSLTSKLLKQEIDKR